SIVAGGPHAAGAYWQVLRAGAEVAVVGDGENAILGLLEYYMGDLDLSSVPNIAFREEGRFRVTRIESVDLDNYRPYSKTINILPPIEIMRGCSYNCSFCQVPFLFKKRVRFRSVESVVDAVKYYVSNGKTLIRFVAPVGLAYQSPDGRRPNPEALEALLRSVRKHGGKPFLGTFPSETRPEQVTRDTLDVLRRYAENTRLAIGMQSGSDRVLALVNREHTVEDVFRAVKLSISYGFTPVVDIIMGLPGEEEEDIRETINAMEKLIAMGAKLRLHTFIPLPGTPLARVKPRGIHPLYRKFIRRMLGRGVLEGDWEYQEKLSFKIYELMASDPYPTPEPRPLDKGTS
ncbi:MAG: TIGR04013 family B12-binding domain/radical SAM domain-containing protein, partial [Pyrodictiaceae archaeon]